MVWVGLYGECSVGLQGRKGLSLWCGGKRETRALNTRALNPRPCPSPVPTQTINQQQPPNRRHPHLVRHPQQRREAARCVVQDALAVVIRQQADQGERIQLAPRGHGGRHPPADTRPRLPRAPVLALCLQSFQPRLDGGQQQQHHMGHGLRGALCCRDVGGFDPGQHVALVLQVVLELVVEVGGGWGGVERRALRVRFRGIEQTPTKQNTAAGVSSSRSKQPDRPIDRKPHSLQTHILHQVCGTAGC